MGCPGWISSADFQSLPLALSPFPPASAECLRKPFRFRSCDLGIRRFILQQYASSQGRTEMPSESYPEVSGGEVSDTHEFCRLDEANEI
jgi:hypothetical protein